MILRATTSGARRSATLQRSNAAPRSTSRACASSTAAPAQSQPMNRRPSSAAATSVVPEPQKKSATRSPGFELAAMMRRSRLSFFWVAHPVFSREKLLIWIESSESLPVNANSAAFAFHTSSSATPARAAACRRAARSPPDTRRTAY
jgi:hypothetical protein